MIERDGELHRFLYRDIASEEALKIILFLYRNQTNGWSAADLRAKLAIENDSTALPVVVKRIELRLNDLCERGLVQRDVHDGLYRYATTDPKQERNVAQIAALGDGELAAAERLMYQRPRTGAAAFADAFAAGRGRS